MMALVGEKNNLINEKLCEYILNFDDVRFVGIIDNMGNVVIDQFKDGVVPFEDDAKRRMLYMQMVLEISMRRDFDSSLGGLNYVISHRTKGLMISLPYEEHVIILSGTHSIEIQEIISKINEIIGANKFRVKS